MIEQIIPRQLKNIRVGTTELTVHAKNIFANLNVRLKDIVNV
jgi:hypothetical protein